MNIKQLHYNILLVTHLASILSLQGAPGDLDTTYGSNNTGIVTLQVGRSNAIKDSFALPDDTLFVCGNVFVTKKNSGFASITQNGAFNSNFNGMGYLPLAIGAATEFHSLAQTPSGKIVGGGYAITNKTVFALAQSDMQGVLDSNFGETGYITTEIGTGASIDSIAIQSDGKIIAGGTAVIDLPKIILVRYNTDGSIDTTFGTNGFVSTEIGYQAGLTNLVLQSDDKIVAAGYAGSAKDTIALLRYNSDGSLDTTFGTNGITTYAMGSRCEIHAIILQPDNKIVLGGSAFNTDLGYNTFLLMRYDTSGNLDPSLNGTGIVFTSLNYGSAIMDIAIDANGNILAGGYDYGAFSTTFALVRYLPSGAIDTSFGTNGIVFTAIGSEAHINSLTIQSDGKIIAAGYSDKYASIARYLA